jgi:autotransporter family porin
MAKPMTAAPPSHGPRHGLLLSTAMLGTLCLGYGRRAYAACAPSGTAGTYACSGSTAATQSLSPTPAAAPLIVTTTPGFGITTATGDAFDLSTTVAGTGLSFIDNNASTIAGAGYGINATNLGGGVLSITANGPVSGLGAGIEAKNYGTSLTINAGAVSGGTFGVYALNQGSGALSITTVGQISGGARGIVARNYGTSLSITAAGASGAVIGIGGYNRGSGSLTITATGTVSGGSVYGLVAKGYQSGQGVTIQAQNVSGGRYGVVGLDYGQGALSITTTGTVTGSNGSGVFAYSAYGTSVKVKTYGPVTGAVDGVYAKLGAYGLALQPAGALSVTAAGSVTGTTGAGI